MAKEWIILEIKKREIAEKEINRLTKEGWELEHVISGHSSMAGDQYQRSIHVKPYVFLSKERND